ncbi:MAG TPA: hypothetical protein VF461_10805 [Gemmatimonadaceae bacterium]
MALLLVLLLYPVWRMLLAKVDRWLEPPIMRQRINAGSDAYFDWLDEHAGESELDDLFGVQPHDDEGDG